VTSIDVISAVSWYGIFKIQVKIAEKNQQTFRYFKICGTLLLHSFVRQLAVGCVSNLKFFKKKYKNWSEILIAHTSQITLFDPAQSAVVTSAPLFVIDSAKHFPVAAAGCPASHVTPLPRIFDSLLFMHHVKLFLHTSNVPLVQ
jgi:hypothetical protein